VRAADVPCCPNIILLTDSGGFPGRLSNTGIGQGLLEGKGTKAVELIEGGRITEGQASWAGGGWKAKTFSNGFGVPGDFWGTRVRGMKEASHGNKTADSNQRDWKREDGSNTLFYLRLEDWKSPRNFNSEGCKPANSSSSREKRGHRRGKKGRRGGLGLGLLKENTSGEGYECLDQQKDMMGSTSLRYGRSVNRCTKDVVANSSEGKRRRRKGQKPSSDGDMTDEVSATLIHSIRAGERGPYTSIFERGIYATT